MKKVVLNSCYGGFGVSKEGVLEVLKRKGLTVVEETGDKFLYRFLASDGNEYGKFSFDREDTELIAAIKECGSKFMSDDCSFLEIEEYDDENFTYWIDEYDGVESLMLEPVVSESKLVNCKSVEEIIDYLESLNIYVKRTK